MAVNNNSEMFLLAFLGSLELSLLALLRGAFLPVLRVLLLVQSGSTLSVDELVVGDELLFVLGLELDHLLEGNRIVLAATVKPELVEHLALDSIA